MNDEITDNPELSETIAHFIGNLLLRGETPTAVLISPVQFSMYLGEMPTDPDVVIEVDFIDQTTGKHTPIYIGWSTDSTDDEWLYTTGELAEVDGN